MLQKLFSSEVKEVYVIENLEDDDWRTSIMDYLKNPNRLTPKKIRLQALHYVIIGDDLYKRAVDGNLLTSLGKHESEIAITEIHEGICGAHQAGDKIRWTLLRQKMY